jgi:hypothetical protein
MEQVEVTGGVKPPVLRRERVTDYDTTNFIELPHLKYDDGGQWRDRAFCKGQPHLTPLFFTEKAKRNNTRAMMVAEAQKLCNQCEVRKECYNFARKNDLRHGVWGGVDFFVSSDYPRLSPLPDIID